MMRYVVGFLFSDRCSSVVLLVKKRPQWQQDRLNGIGGKIEPGETPLQAMVRECDEEIGVTVNEWIYFATVQGPDYETLFYAARDQQAYHNVQQKTDEEVIYSLVRLIPQTRALESLHFLIPRAVYILQHPYAAQESWKIT